MWASSGSAWPGSVRETEVRLLFIPLNNPNARYWDDLVEDFGFTPEEQEAVSGLSLSLGAPG